MNRPLWENRACSGAALILWALVGSLATESARAEGGVASATLGLLGNEKILWIYQNQTDAQNVELVRFAYRTAGDAVKGRYWRGPVVTGRIDAATLLGTNIHVFFHDGTHRRFSPIRFGVTPAPTPVSLEMKLPDGALPFVLASDETNHLLYAVVTVRVAEKIEEDRARRLALDRAFSDDEPVEQQADDDTTEPDEHPPVGDDGVVLKNAARLQGSLVIVRYDRGRWHVDRPGPTGLTRKERIACLSANDGGLLLFAGADPASTSSVTLWWSARADDPFKNVGAMPRSGEMPVAAAWRDEQTWVVSSGPVDSGTDVTLDRWNGKAWSPSVTMLEDGGLATAFSTPFAATMFGDTVAVATLDESGTLRVGLWSVDSGAPVEPPATVHALTTLPAPTLTPTARHALQYAVLAAALVAVFVWRRDRVIAFAPIKPDQRFARLERRGLAFVIDLAIVAPVWIPIVFALWRAGAPDLSVGEQLMQGQRLQSGPMFWSGALAGAVFGLYAGIQELFAGRTFGKRIVGCYVVGEGGEPCTVQAVFVRNILRVVEFHFVAMAVLVVLTPSRQRLGDMLARTVVVEHDLPGSNASDTDSMNDSDSDGPGEPDAQR